MEKGVIEGIVAGSTEGPSFSPAITPSAADPGTSSNCPTYQLSPSRLDATASDPPRLTSILANGESRLLGTSAPAYCPSTGPDIRPGCRVKDPDLFHAGTKIVMNARVPRFGKRSPHNRVVEVHLTAVG
jgi:hypothetical protein